MKLPTGRGCGRLSYPGFRSPAADVRFGENRHKKRQSARLQADGSAVARARERSSVPVSGAAGGCASDALTREPPNVWAPGWATLRPPWGLPVARRGWGREMAGMVPDRRARAGRREDGDAATFPSRIDGRDRDSEGKRAPSPGPERIWRREAWRGGAGARSAAVGSVSRGGRDERGREE